MLNIEGENCAEKKQIFGKCGAAEWKFKLYSMMGKCGNNKKLYIKW